MKILLFVLMLSFGLCFSTHAQKNACDNVVLIYAPPTKISNLDSTIHESIQNYFRRYLISQQQAFNYKLVENRSDASVELITTYVLRNPGFWNQTTEMEFSIKDVDDSLIYRTVIEAYSTEDSTLYYAGKDKISHKGSDFLETLQRQNTLHAFFAPLLDKGYRHKAEPDQVLVVDPFVFEDVPELAPYVNCLQDILIKGMQVQARFVGHNINISFQEPPNTTPSDVPVVRVMTEIEDFADEYVLSFSTDSRRYIHEITIPKKLLTNALYRPFIEGKVMAAGGGLIGRIIF